MYWYVLSPGLDVGNRGEIGGVQVIRFELDAERLFEERHQLQRGQRIENAAFLELGVIGEILGILTGQKVLKNEVSDLIPYAVH